MNGDYGDRSAIRRFSSLTLTLILTLILTLTYPFPYSTPKPDPNQIKGNLKGESVVAAI